MKFVEKYTAWWSEQNGSNVPLSVQERESETNVKSINVDEYGVTLVGLSMICLRPNIFIMPRISGLFLSTNISWLKSPSNIKLLHTWLACSIATSTRSQSEKRG